MASKHFANTGQVLQLVVAAIGVMIAGANAYPSIAASNFLSIWPIVFYLVMILSALAFARWFRLPSPALPLELPLALKSEPEPFTRLPDGRPILAKISGTTFKLKTGERKMFGADGTEILAIELNSISTSAKNGLCADLTIRCFITQITVGILIEERPTKSLNEKRYLVPRSEHAFGDAALIRISFSATSIDIDLVKVDHISEYLGEIDVTVVRSYGFARS